MTTRMLDENELASVMGGSQSLEELRAMLEAMLGQLGTWASSRAPDAAPSDIGNAGGTGNAGVAGNVGGASFGGAGGDMPLGWPLTLGPIAA